MPLKAMMYVSLYGMLGGCVAALLAVLIVRYFHIDAPTSVLVGLICGALGANLGIAIGFSRLRVP